MRQLYLLSFIVLMVFAPQSFSNTETAQTDTPLVFEIVQNEFVFNRSTVDKATIIERRNGTYGGLLVKLKPTAAPTLERISLLGIRKRANLIFNNHIISTAIVQSPLKDSLLIVGISKEDAQKFIDDLKQKSKRGA